MQILQSKEKTATMVCNIEKTFEHSKPVPYESELRELRKQIFKNPSVDYSANDIAASMNLSVSYLNKIYHTLFGTSVMKDVFSARMEYAQTLLSQTDLFMRSLRYAVIIHTSIFHVLLKNTAVYRHVNTE